MPHQVKICVFIGRVEVVEVACLHPEEALVEVAVSANGAGSWAALPFQGSEEGPWDQT